MITKIYSIEELYGLVAEIALLKTDKITKVSPHTVNSGLFYGVAKTGQKALKEIAINEAHLFPESAYGALLDNIKWGDAERFTESKSSTHIRVVGDVGTSYLQSTHTVTGSHGVVFDLQEDVTIGDHGYAYIKVRSQTAGKITNVDALTIDKISPIPVGHDYLINEYKCIGGRDDESDELFRRRIQQGSNKLANGTISYLEQVFNKINESIIKLFFGGFANGKVILYIATHNGSDLTSGELDDLEAKAYRYLSLTDIKPFGAGYSGVDLRNIGYEAIDISFRCDLDTSFDPDDIRRNIQVKFSKYLDFRFWDYTKRVEWDDLLEIVKNTKGVKYVPDTNFFPNTDLKVQRGKLPRIRGFLMLDLQGNTISNVAGTLNPVYYPAKKDFAFQATVLKSL